MVLSRLNAENTRLQDRFKKMLDEALTQSLTTPNTPVSLDSVSRRAMKWNKGANAARCLQIIPTDCYTEMSDECYSQFLRLRLGLKPSAFISNTCSGCRIFTATRLRFR